VAGVFILLGLGVLQTVRPQRGMEEGREGDAEIIANAAAAEGAA
jgi:hypothetical protein